MAGLGNILAGGPTMPQAAATAVPMEPPPGAAGAAITGAQPGAMPGIGPPVDEADLTRRHSSWSEFLTRPEIIGGLLAFSEAIIQPNATFPGALNQAVRTAGAAVGAQRELRMGDVKAARDARGFETQEQLRQQQIAESQAGIMGRESEVGLREAQTSALEAETSYVGREKEAVLAKLKAETERALRPESSTPQQAPADIQELNRLTELVGLDKALELKYSSKTKGKTPHEEDLAYARDYALKKQGDDITGKFDHAKALKEGYEGAQAAREFGAKTEGAAPPSVKGTTDKAKLFAYIKKDLGIHFPVQIDILKSGKIKILNETGTVLRTIDGAQFRN